MKKLVSSGRLFAFGVLVVTLIALCVVTLYKLQIIEGAAYYEESQNNQASNQTVTAARGNILDRYGRVLVSNRECYNLKISDTRLFSDEVEMCIRDRRRPPRCGAAARRRFPRAGAPGAPWPGPEVFRCNPCLTPPFAQPRRTLS